MIRATVESAPFSVIIGDYDGDDRLDLVTASTSRNLTLLSNRGPGFGDEISGGDPPVPTPPDRVTLFPANETDVLQVQDATVFFTDNVVFTASASTLTPGSSGGAAGGGLPVLDEVVVEAVTVDVTSRDELLVLPESRAADVAKFDIADFEPPLPPVEGEPKAASDPDPVEEPQSTIGEPGESSGKSWGLMAGVIGTASATLSLLLEITRRRWKKRSAKTDRSMKSFAEMAKDQEK